MKCKFCQADLEDGNSVCPVCGKENEIPEQEPAETVIPDQENVPAQEQAVVEETAEAAQEAASEETAPESAAQEIPDESAPAEKEAPQIKEGMKMNSGKVAIAVVAGVLVLAVLVSVLISGMGGKFGKTNGKDDPGKATEVAGTVPPDGEPNTVTSKGTYTVSDEDAVAAKDTVVATMGGKELTNSDLQIYYWMQVNAFLSQFGQYAPYMGLDYTKPLDTQMYQTEDGKTMTWQQYFLMSALDAWQRYQSLALEAESVGFQLDEEIQKHLDGLPEDLQKNAEQLQFADAEAMVRDSTGAAGTMEAYMRYMTVYYQGYQYFSSEYEKFLPTDADVAAYFDEHADEYAEKEITKDSGYTVDVRHILIAPEGGTADEKGNKTYSDEEWEACRAAAQEILDQWLAGDKTQESFAKLAGEHSTDTGSKTNGGLYTGVSKGDMVEEFDAWCFDESRQPGDYGLVKTKFGYHIMYFAGSQDIWYAAAQADMIAEQSNTLVETAMAKYPAEIQYDKIVLGLVNMAR